MVADIVGKISDQLFSMEPLDLSHIVGMNVHMEQLSPLLSVESEKEVRVIGIWGMGGIGKTTIAKYLYEEYSRQFDSSCFIENVRILAQNGLPYLQEKLISILQGQKQETSFWCVEKGYNSVKSNLKGKVFVVLDDVDNLDQLQAVAKTIDWFGAGSRIIITTRDFGLLYSFGVRLLYHVSFLDSNDAIQVFKQAAFERGQAPSDVYHQFSIRASRLAQGLPSALDAFGTYLRRITWIEGWEDALRILETIPHQSIIDIVDTSYRGLDDKEKSAFLHVACLFNRDSLQRVNDLLVDGALRTNALEAKSLIEISPVDGCITMHLLIEQAARNIGTTTTEGVALNMCKMLHTSSIKGNVLKDINSLTFFKAFTDLNDIESKLKFIPGTDMLPSKLRLLHWDAYPMKSLPPGYSPHCLVEIILRHSKLERLWDGTLLRILDVTGSKNLTKTPDLSRATRLKELIMKGCTGLEQPPDVLPESGLRRRRQVIMKLPGAVKKRTSLSNLSIEGKIQIKWWHLRGNAEHLSLISEQHIPEESMVMMPKERFPFISSFYDFKSLSIKRFSYIEDGASFECISFSGFPCLAELKLINLNIQKIPEDICRLRSLEKLDLSGNDFTNLPSSMKNLSKLKYISLSNCSTLEALPELTEVQTLKLSNCSNLTSLVELSQDVGSYSLQELELDNCKNVQSFSNQLSHFTKLTYLNLSGNDFEAIPASIRELPSLSLKHLYAHGCCSLVTVSPNHSIKHLDLSHCFSLQQDEQLISRFLNGDNVLRFLCLPGTKMPRYFDNQSHGIRTKISQPQTRLTPMFVGFAACIMVSCERSFYLQFPTFSYDWKRDDDNDVIRINLKPNLYLSREIEEGGSDTRHHMVIIHVPCSINADKMEELRLESHLQLREEQFQFPPGEISACGTRIVAEDKDEATMVADIVGNISSPLLKVKPANLINQENLQLFIRASQLAHGLPSALVAYATYLSESTTIETWEEELRSLEARPHKRVEEILRISYNDLDELDKTAFLHVACLFNGYLFNHVTSLLDEGRPRMNHLNAKSLISISTDGCINMHCLVEQTGREIVRQESGNRPSKQRFLWDPNEIYDVLNNNIGTDQNEGVTLHMCDMLRTLFMSDEVFSNMRFLNFFKFFQHLGDIESKDAYPLEKLPYRFQHHNLVELNLRYSNLESLWNEAVDQKLWKLRRLDVTGSRNLIKLPDLSTAANFEELIIESCMRLQNIPESISRSHNLKKLNAINCDLLRGVIFNVDFLKGRRRQTGSWRTIIKSLEIKRLGYIESNAPFSCNSFECFPFLTKLKLINLNIQEIAGDISDLQFLETLDLTGNDFKSLPSTMGQIAKLKYLSLQNCRELRALPQLGQLRSLRGLVGVELLELRLENCRGLRSLSEELSHFTKITYLDLSSLEFETIPASIRELPSLGTLCLNKCNHLISLEELPLSLSYLYAHGCESLKNVSLSPHHSIKHLDLSHCFNLHQEQDLLSQFINQGQNQQVKPRFACLPKAEMPRDFENRSLGTCTTISLPPIRDSHSLKPDLNRSSEIDVTSHHLIVIQVPSSIDDEEIDELQFESHLRVAEEWPGLKNVKRDEGRKPATLAARRESDPKIACGVLLIKCRSREESTCLKG
ncbi:hypothetical protein HID58_073130 [Brassica napus]|uniref:ADP-ribosyl cyclase/cyclic ADP-ribose hydrolase n=1 Tax=Brassica napus TaxID=3708 RepID=A0ABQ7Z6K0_BRANA|nr:hypothetical protein HID58_073130 [Brassica napus]